MSVVICLPLFICLSAHAFGLSKQLRSVMPAPVRSEPGGDLPTAVNAQARPHRRIKLRRNDRAISVARANSVLRGEPNHFVRRRSDFHDPVNLGATNFV
ncbi:hypothetical protein, partial [Bradyrhizobium sp. 38]|uniref:hypothetical protein n=1 Tax=Bradyrhizobium sp. 38 TaxID=2782672 RepID=UPI001FF704F2